MVNKAFYKNTHELNLILKNAINGSFANKIQEPEVKKGRDLETHPMVLILKQASKQESPSPDMLSKYCDVRYNASSQFEELLEHTQKLAARQGQADISLALERNLCDERGLNYDDKKPHGLGAHSEWRKDFLDVINVKTRNEKSFPLYQFSKDDSLYTLTGIILVTEMMVPREDKRLLAALIKSFPGVFAPIDGSKPDAAQQKAALYLQDHMKHDAERHFPELFEATLKAIHAPYQLQEVKEGVDRFVKERLRFYDHIQKELDLEPVYQKTTLTGRSIKHAYTEKQ